MHTRTAIAALLFFAPLAFAQSGSYKAVPLPSGEHPTILPPAHDSTFDLSWNTIDGGGGFMGNGSIELSGTVAQPDAGVMAVGNLELIGGFQVLTDEAPACYANCDNSTAAPILNINDFLCFMNQFNAGNMYTNCDNSTVAPILNAIDFQCFMNKYAAGCP